MDDHETRIRERAHRLWLQEGRPQGREQDLLAMARELVAIEDNQKLATKPVRRDPADPTIAADEVEPAAPAAAEGELPTLTDEGEQQYPPSRTAELAAADAVSPDARELENERKRRGSRRAARTKTSR
jgi:hypothetical protein